ncbi:MAG: hypothetical protein GF383_15920 [Candidatus Lokiarchaeota archaeon]|nr:hypothetical protein [Candidatus Lokiarchaeota archaeon]MBD3343193.1 hypothetical protein [Candidatus Lokiarchaeota archaeon]
MQQYFLIFLPAFLLGLLHTAMPCEDKAIFCFWSFGISKEPRNSIFILILYGFGLMCANMIIGMGTFLISLIPLIFIPQLFSDPFAINFFGAFSSTFVAIFFLFLMTHGSYFPHSKSVEEFMKLNWEKRRTPFLFGMLAGFPPCIFELLIYSQCLIYSLSYGFFEGFFTVFYFTLGTFIGLFPLAMAKQGLQTTQIIKPKQNTDLGKNKVFILMFLIIVMFNIIIMILSFLRIHIFPPHNL